MGRGNSQKDREQGPERKCIATGEVRPKHALIRFVVAPDGQLAPDIPGKLPGRGIWVTATRSALDKVVSKKLFTKAARMPVQVDSGLAEQVESLLARKVLELISLSRKSGRAVAGYEKVKDWLSKEEALVLIQAVDGSGRGKSKLSTPHYGHYIGCLTSEELGLAFGRQTVIHAALASGGLTQRVVEEAQRLKGLREKTADMSARKEKTAL